MVQSRQAEEKIRAILTFPGGWLIEEEEGDEMRWTPEMVGRRGWVKWQS